jgi:hypothetical protein
VIHKATGMGERALILVISWLLIILYICLYQVIYKIVVKVSDKELKSLVLTESKDGTIGWTPEDYGFKSPLGMTGVWYSRNLELRSRPNNFWLLRKKIKNDKGNPEMLVKFFLMVCPNEKEWADQVFTKGLR